MTLRSEAHEYLGPVHGRHAHRRRVRVVLAHDTGSATRTHG
jgi:hypothetical protein